MNRNVGDIIAGLFLLFILYILVRPSSKANELVTAVTRLMVAVVGGATDIAAPHNGIPAGVAIIDRSGTIST
jgi:hypothetical protein